MNLDFISGSVVDINLQYAGTFTIEMNKYTYICQYKEFFPILGSVVSGAVEKVHGTYFFSQLPNQDIPTYNASLSESMIKHILKYCFNSDTTKRLLTYLKTDHQSGENLFKQFYYITSEKTKNDFLRLLELEEYNKLVNHISSHKDSLLLMAFGLKEYKVKKLDADKKKEILETPFEYYRFTIPQAVSLSQLLDHKYDYLDYIAGTIGRVLYKRLKEKLWTYSPIYDLPKEITERLIEYGMIFNKSNIMFREVQSDERQLATIFTILTSLTPSNEWENWQPVSSKLTEQQIDVVRKTLSLPISLIIGAAGTGKSFCISEIAQTLNTNKIKYACASFTGKAVARVKELLIEKISGKLPIFTLHSMYLNKSINTEYGDITYLILDESSMIAGKLLIKVLKVYKSIKHIILVGDYNQLDPFSGWGRPFLDLYRSRKFPTYTLTKNFRQTIENGKENGIVNNAQAMLRRQPLTDYDNFTHHTGNLDFVIEKVTQAYNSGLKPDDIKVICPYRKEVDDINRRCQKFWSVGKPSMILYDNYFYLADPVMMTINCRDIGVMNGDTGIICDMKKDCLTVAFGSGSNKTLSFYYEHEFTRLFSLFNHLTSDNIQSVNQVIELIRKYVTNDDIEEIFSQIEDNYLSQKKEKIKEGRQLLNKLIDNITDGLQIKNLKLAYALTVHKAQGSEYPQVIYYVPRNKKQPPDWNRFVSMNMTYTAITRARQEVVVIDADNEVEESVSVTPPERKDLFYNYIMSSK